MCDVRTCCYSVLHVKDFNNISALSADFASSPQNSFLSPGDVTGCWLVHVRAYYMSINGYSKAPQSNLNK